MPRRLIVLRHAKSAWNTSAPSDHARPLNKRGRRDAPRIGEALRQLDWVPQRIFSSDSCRTRETWRRMKVSLLGAEEVAVHFAETLYHAGLEEVRALLLRELLGELGEGVETVMVIGHNPGWEEMVSVLCGDELRLTTCNAALLSHAAASWREALSDDQPAAWQLSKVVRPKEL